MSQKKTSNVYNRLQPWQMLIDFRNVFTTTKRTKFRTQYVRFVERFVRFFISEIIANVRYDLTQFSRLHSSGPFFLDRGICATTSVIRSASVVLSIYAQTTCVRAYGRFVTPQLYYLHGHSIVWQITDTRAADCRAELTGKRPVEAQKLQKQTYRNLYLYPDLTFGAVISRWRSELWATLTGIAYA